MATPVGRGQAGPHGLGVSRGIQADRVKIGGDPDGEVAEPARVDAFLLANAVLCPVAGIDAENAVEEWTSIVIDITDATANASTKK
jgi:hypothetical protein